MTNTKPSRKATLNLIRFAGYHGDKGTATRLYIEARGVSLASLQAAYREGAQSRATGMPCGCCECKEAA